MKSCEDRDDDQDCEGLAVGAEAVDQSVSVLWENSLSAPGDDDADKDDDANVMMIWMRRRCCII